MSTAHQALRRLAVCSSILLSTLAPSALAADAAATAPIAAKTAWQETRHGTVVTDDYRWLQKKTDPAVIDLSLIHI